MRKQSVPGSLFPSPSESLGTRLPHTMYLPMVILWQANKELREKLSWPQQTHLSTLNGLPDETDHRRSSKDQPGTQALEVEPDCQLAVSRSPQEQSTESSHNQQSQQLGDLHGKCVESAYDQLAELVVKSFDDNHVEYDSTVKNSVYVN